MGETAVQMIHYGTWGTNHHAKTAQKIAKEGLRLDEWMEQMYLNRIREKQPKYTLEKLKELLDHDSFFTAKQSVALGLADSIG
jgi:ATP-dependent protease ClpP protease subunit